MMGFGPLAPGQGQHGSHGQPSNLPKGLSDGRRRRGRRLGQECVVEPDDAEILGYPKVPVAGGGQDAQRGRVAARDDGRRWWVEVEQLLGHPPSVGVGEAELFDQLRVDGEFGRGQRPAMAVQAMAGGGRFGGAAGESDAAVAQIEQVSGGLVPAGPVGGADGDQPVVVVAGTDRVDGDQSDAVRRRRRDRLRGHLGGAPIAAGVNMGAASAIGVILVAVGLTLSLLLNRLSGSSRMESQQAGL